MQKELLNIEIQEKEFWLYPRKEDGYALLSKDSGDHSGYFKHDFESRILQYVNVQTGESIKTPG